MEKQIFLPFSRNVLCVAVCSAMCCLPAYANDDVVRQPEKQVQTESTVPHMQTLETVTVKAKRRVGRKDNEVTGLGKIVKTSKDFDTEQIMNIRDLTRYDPGISVVEQGRGASSGYSMRGVDRNRVGMQVDGLVQAQSYASFQSSANGGAINEIEYENLRSIELSKGASSSEYGSGALGGAVGFRTKEAADIIQSGKNWGLHTKTAYGSKNGQLANSVGFAGKMGGFEGLVQYTHRKGHETKAHRAAGDGMHEITRLGAYADEYDLRVNSTENQLSANWFRIEGECDATDCAKAGAVLTKNDNAWLTKRTTPPYTPEEEAAYAKQAHLVEKLSGKDYTGKDRILPNPMDYLSKSWLLKGGYRFNARHYLGGVYENTKQNYDIADKSVAAYYLPSEFGKSDVLTRFTGGRYIGTDPITGFTLPYDDIPAGLGYTRASYYNERHSKKRAGLVYRYENKDKNTWLDKAAISLDRQDISLDTLFRDHRCSVYPTFDPNCRADVNKPWSFYQSHRSRYSEKHNVLQMDLSKQFKLENITHNVNFQAGYDKFDSSLYRGDYLMEYAKATLGGAKSGNGTRDNPYVYAKPDVQIVRENQCQYASGGNRDCRTRDITGHNRYIALRDHIAFGKWVDLGLGIRHDQHVFKTDDILTGAGKYRNTSWNMGLTVKPTRHLALSYRVSNGFRVPAFYELFGIRVDGASATSHVQYKSDLKPEKSLNHEFGLGVKGNFGHLEASYFRNDYKDLIAIGDRLFPNTSKRGYGYHNMQDIKLHGVNFLGKLYWHGIWDKLPDGLHSSLAYNQIKVRSANTKSADEYNLHYSPMLDTLQPARYVAGLGYDHPDGKWGVNMMMTYSKPKNNNELIGSRVVGVNQATSATKIRTNRWYIYDLTGYVNLKDNFTLRAGVYNLTNRKYATWEAVRQSSVNAVNREQSNHAARYAAPGRNFTVALEMKF